VCVCMCMRVCACGCVGYDSAEIYILKNEQCSINSELYRGSI